VAAYQINDLERLTGIKAHTIRIWERRYALIKPYRTDTNRRFYDDEQVRKLLNVTTLLSYGHKISKIASLDDEEIFRQIETGAPGTGVVYAHTAYVNDLVTTMISYDEDGFEKIFSAAVLRMGLYDAMLNVIYPFLKKIGVLWSVNKAAPIQEHFASCIVRRKLMAAVDGQLQQSKTRKKILLFLPPDEWHEIGLLFANYMMRAQGHETIYLGQNVPLDDVEKVVEGTQPHAIFTLFIAPRPVKEISDFLVTYAKNDLPIYFSGDTGLTDAVKDLPNNVHKLDNVTALTEILQTF